MDMVLTFTFRSLNIVRLCTSLRIIMVRFSFYSLLYCGRPYLINHFLNSNPKLMIPTLIPPFTATLQGSNPHMQPPAEQLAEMTARASEVVRLLDALKNDTHISAASLLSSTSTHNTLVSVHSHHSLDSLNAVKSAGSSLGMAIMDVDAPDRAPKRPWEDVEGMLPPQVGQALQGSGAAAQGSTDQDRSMAEADMELIRTKRALTTLAAAAALGSGGGGTSGGKNKYRKRSVSSFSSVCDMIWIWC
jgi:hypothetical protein